MRVRQLLPVLHGALLLLLDGATGFCLCSTGLSCVRSPRYSGQCGGTVSLSMQKAEDAWNVGRFAKTFGFFNGNPLLKLIPFVPSTAPSVRLPAPVVVSDNELLLWSFDGLDSQRFGELWAPLDDVVMGGVSVSNIALAAHGATLSGETSSRNNGGFCSARTRNSGAHMSPNAPLAPVAAPVPEFVMSCTLKATLTIPQQTPHVTLTAMTSWACVCGATRACATR